MAGSGAGPEGTHGIESFLTSKAGLAPNTVRTYSELLGSYARWNGGDGIDITSYHRYIQHLRVAGHAQNGIATASVVLREYARHLDISVSKWEGAPTEERQFIPLRKNEMRMLRDACAKERKPEACRFIVDFLVGTAMRVSEFVALRWSDMDLSDGTCVIMLGKRHKGRTINLSKTAIDATLKYMRYRFGEGMTAEQASLRAERVCPVAGTDAVRAIVRRVASRAGLDARGIHPHLFRHTFGASAESGGMKLHSLQAHLGHSSIHTTARYEQYSVLEDTKYLKEKEIV